MGILDKIVFESPPGKRRYRFDEGFAATDFRKNYDAQFDIIYGTNGDRDSYIIKLVYNDFCADYDDPAVEEYDKRIDDYTRGWFAACSPYVNEYNDYLARILFDPKGLPETLPDSAKGLKPGKAGYALALNADKRLGPTGVAPADQKRFAKEDSKQASLVSVTGLNEQQLQSLHYFLSIRRACKFGLAYFSTHAMKGTTSKVHYILDEIVIAEVIQKTHRVLFGSVVTNAPRTGVPITTSELRFLFRNWYVFPQDQRSRIFFYRKCQAVPPPWEEDPTPWLGYARYQLEKAKASTERLKEFDAFACLPTKRAKAMQLYASYTSGMHD